MHYPNIVRRLGAVPGLMRLVSIVLECISVVLLVTRQRPGEGYMTDYMIVGFCAYPRFSLTSLLR